ncbi:MAG: hypothetical protein JWP42_149 [Pseudomonas sp.]|nr:hypothetical protein [Pseudomonas sp.]
MLAKDVNDDVFWLVQRGALESIASKLAPTVDWGVRIPSIANPSVGAGLLAKVVNDDVFCLVQRGALGSIASKLAPTVDWGARGYRPLQIPL